MKRKPNKRNAKLTLGVIKSAHTKKIYLSLSEGMIPFKLWDIEKIDPIGLDIINELLKSYDLGYDIEYQFPRDVEGLRKIVPLEVVLVGEENGKPINIFNKPF